jgi:hypothetical protein
MASPEFPECPMPKRVLIIGLLFCLGGILAIWTVVSDLARSHINLNFAVLLLPVGIGLLRGRASSQWWARFWIILGYIFSGLLVTLAIAFPESIHTTWFKEEIRGSAAVPYVIGLSVLACVPLVILHRLLYSEKAIAFFRRTGEQTNGPNLR